MSTRFNAKNLSLPVSTGVQLATLAGICIVGDAIVRAFRLPVSGGVVGMMLLLIALGAGAIKPKAIRKGAELLTTNLLLFFVPAFLSILEHPEFTGSLGVKLLLIIVLGTFVVMSATGCVVELLLRLMKRKIL